MDIKKATREAKENRTVRGAFPGWCAGFTRRGHTAAGRSEVILGRYLPLPVLAVAQLEAEVGGEGLGDLGRGEGQLAAERVDPGRVRVRARFRGHFQSERFE